MNALVKSLSHSLTSACMVLFCEALILGGFGFSDDQLIFVGSAGSRALHVMFEM
jgi:hypothetical protein